MRVKCMLVMGVLFICMATNSIYGKNTTSQKSHIRECYINKANALKKYIASNQQEYICSIIEDFNGDGIEDLYIFSWDKEVCAQGDFYTWKNNKIVKIDEVNFVSYSLKTSYLLKNTIDSKILLKNIINASEGYKGIEYYRLGSNGVELYLMEQIDTWNNRVQYYMRDKKISKADYEKELSKYKDEYLIANSEKNPIVKFISTINNYTIDSKKNKSITAIQAVEKVEEKIPYPENVKFRCIGTEIVLGEDYDSNININDIDGMEMYKVEGYYDNYICDHILYVDKRNGDVYEKGGGFNRVGRSNVGINEKVQMSNKDAYNYLDMTYKELLEKYGKPIRLGASEYGDRFKFEGIDLICVFDFCMDTPSLYEKALSIQIVNSSDSSIFGVNTRMSFQEIKNILGVPTSQGHSEQEVGEYVTYTLGDYILHIAFEPEFSKIIYMSVSCAS